MTIDINFTKEPQGVIFTVAKNVTGKEIYDAHKTAIADSNFKNQKYWLVDRTECEQFKVTPDELIEISKIDNTAAKINPRLLMAIIASTDVQYGMSRLYSAYIDENGFKTCIFKKRAEADSWIWDELAG